MKAADNTNGATHIEDDIPARPALTKPNTPDNRMAIDPENVAEKLTEARNGSLPSPKRRNRSRVVIALAALAVAVAVAPAAYYVEFVAPYESTDDAFIETDVTPIAPQVAGRVARLLVQDNQEVQQGEVLLEIDPRDFQAALDQAKANLAAAKSRLDQANTQLAVDQAKVGQEKANVTAVEAEAKRAEADLKRFQAVGRFAVSQSQLDLAETQARSSAAQVDVARNKELAAEAQAALDRANIETATAEIQKNGAALRQAELDLSYTRVTAPVSGLVTHRTVQVGAYIQPGQALLALVPRNVWVVANFKETQLTRIRPGQPVAVKVDAYPRIEFKGHVDSIQSGAGARFSLLPPENASGNYVKVVQRVPVKIALDNFADAKYVLGPGMSVEPEIRVN